MSEVHTSEMNCELERPEGLTVKLNKTIERVRGGQVRRGGEDEKKEEGEEEEDEEKGKERMKKKRNRKKLRR
jgi:hypothetical protein